MQALQIVSQAARVDPSNYAALDKASICSRVGLTMTPACRELVCWKRTTARSRCTE